MKVCSRCKTENRDVANFCKECGNKLTENFVNNPSVENNPQQSYEKFDFQSQQNQLNAQDEPRDTNSLAQLANKDNFAASVAGVSSVSGAASADANSCLLYTSPSPRDVEESRMPSSA